jgi:GTP-binding protein HflX
MTFISEDINRVVAVLVDRQGRVEEVMVGDNRRVYLPDIGRGRAAQSRFRGIRLIRTYLGETGRDVELTRDDLTDLSKLQLDMVVSVAVGSGGYPGRTAWAYLVPENPEDRLWEIDEAVNPAEVDVDFQRFIEELEGEFQRKATTTVRTGGQPAILVYVSTPGDRGVDNELAEMLELCRTAGVDVVDTIVQKRSRVHPKYAVGKGKLEETTLRALQRDADLIIFGQDLEPRQLRAITDETDLRVIDRTQLILDIFAQHAKSRDGKLQVELAQLQYNLPRLHSKNTGMSRLTGGIGGRGPGETKLEINRRRARDKIRKLEKEIDKISDQRALRRKRRVNRPTPIVSIVGYTNAGKSTLLNHLTTSDVTSANKLFATLRPTTRSLEFPDKSKVIFTDTVGFIHELPQDLMDAFRATLEELEESDLLVHLVDISDENFEEQMEAVDRVLGELGLSETEQLLVFNKVDLVDDEEVEALSHRFRALPISALEERNIDMFLETVRSRVGR